MARTNEQIDALNVFNKGLGLEPIPYENEEVVTQEPPKQEPIITTQEAPQEPVTNQEQVLSQEVKVPQLEINDTAVLDFLKSKGIELQSLDEVKERMTAPLSEEEKTKAAEKREADKLTFGLQKGLFTSKEYEAFVYDSKNEAALVYDQWAAKQIKRNAEISNEELHEKFREEFGLDYDKSSDVYQDGQEKLALMRDKLMREKHGKLLDLEEKYSAYENETAATTAFNKKITAELPRYTKDISEVISEVSKHSVVIGDENNPQTYTFDFPSEELENVKNLFLSDEKSKDFIKQGWNKEQIKGIVNQILLVTHFDKIVAKIAKDHASQELLTARRESHGIPSQKASDITDKNKEVIPDAVKKIMAGLNLPVEQ